MYKKLIITKTLQGLLVLFGLTGLLIIILYLNLNTFSQYDISRQIELGFFFIGCDILVWLYVFWYLFMRIGIKADKSIRQKSLGEIKSEIKEYFSQAKQGDDTYFQIEEKDNTMKIYWNKKIDHNQLFSAGDLEVDYRAFFEFDEKRRNCNIYTSVIRTSKGDVTFGTFYSKTWTGGIGASTEANHIPSFEFKDGHLCMDIKKLQYNSDTIVAPVTEILKMDGWSSKFVMLKHKITRIIYNIIGWILLAVAILAIYIGSMAFTTKNYSIYSVISPPAVDKNGNPKYYTTEDQTTASDAVSISKIDPAFKIEELKYDLYGEGEDDVYIAYPQFKDITGGFNKIINDSIASSSRGGAFKSAIADLEDEKKQGNGYDYLHNKSNVVGVYLSPHKLMSYADLTSSYYGGPHGTMDYHSTVFDMDNGQILGIKDLLKTGYGSLLKDIVIKKIETALESATTSAECDGCKILDGTEWVEDKNFKLDSVDFILSKDGITLLFGSYGLGPYVVSSMGQTVYISKTELKDYIKKDW